MGVKELKVHLTISNKRYQDPFRKKSYLFRLKINVLSAQEDNRPFPLSCPIPTYPQVSTREGEGLGVERRQAILSESTRLS